MNISRSARLALVAVSLLLYSGPPAMIAAERIVAVDGGAASCLAQELWNVPRGEHAPVPTPNAFPGRRKR